MNHWAGSGRLTREPEGRTTQTGKSVCTFTIAVDDGWGEKKQTTFVPVAVWDKRGETCAKYLEKGQMVTVEGRLTIRDYNNSKGEKRRAVEIVANNVEFGAKARNSSGGEPGGYYQGEGFYGQSMPDEEIPF